MASNDEVEFAALANTTTTTPDPFLISDGTLFDFREMAVVDWDEVHDGYQLGPRDYTSWNALNIARLTLAIWIICSHIAIIVFVLGKAALRSQPKNLLIVNVALANMLLGVFVVPAKLHFILNSDTVDCGAAIGWDFIANYYQPSLALFAVFSLVFERFVYVYAEKKQQKVKRVASIVGTIALLLAPWLLSCLFLLPVYWFSLRAKSSNSETPCLYKVEDNFFLAAQLISFIPASLGVFILAPFTGLLDCLRPRHCFYKPLTPKGESLTVTAFVTLFAIFSEAPFCIVRVLMMRLECNNPYCTRFSETLTITWWLRIAKASVFPFIWLLYTDIREAMRCDLDFSLDEHAHHDSDDEVDEIELRPPSRKRLIETRYPDLTTPPTPS